MTRAPFSVEVDTALVHIVRPVAVAVEPVAVSRGAPWLDQPLADAAERLRAGDVPAHVTAAVRSLYKRIGIDPTKTRPSSEALVRRVRKGDGLPRVNSLVDVINWCSAETQLPYGLYDRHHIDGAVQMRLGHAGESYPGIRKDEVHVGGRLVLADAIGAFGNPTSDSLRTAVTEVTTAAVVVIFAPAELPHELAASAMQLTLERLESM
ncbi:MAG: B3/4 domain-containing protein [Vicinamibacterales bacterium]